MALQGDGNGIVTIPNASTTGDFSVIFDSVKITNPANAEILLGQAVGASNFIAIFTPSSISARVAGFNTSPRYTGSPDEIVKLEVKRVGTQLSLVVDDVDISTITMDAGLTFELGTFFAYNSGQLKGNMLLGGIVTMTGFGGVRTYDTEGSGTTLVDTTSGQNGTLSGFTTGGFTVPSGDIAVDFPVSNYFKRGDSNKQIVIPFSGACTTSGIIEYSYDNLIWSVLDATPTGVFSGSVTITGQQDVYVRASDNVGTVVALTKLTATDLNIAIAMSQSNGVTRVSNHQPTNITAGKPIPMLYKAGAYSVLADPTSYAENYGSYWTYIAKWYSDNDILIGLTNVAVGGTSISSWQPASLLLDRCEAFASDAGGLDVVFTVIGETDSEGSMPQATFETLYSTSAQHLFTTYGCDIRAIKFPVGVYLGGITDPSVVAIRAAYDNLINDYAFIKSAGDLSVIDIDLAGGDGLHLKTDAQALEASQIIIAAMEFIESLLNLSAAGYPDGTYSAEFYQATSPLVHIKTESVTFSGGTSSATIPIAASTTVYTRIDGAAPPSTGVTCYGVTV